MNNKTEIFTCVNFPDGSSKSITFQYETGSKLLEKMTRTLRKIESEGKLHIIEIRPAEYHI